MQSVPSHFPVVKISTSYTLHDENVNIEKTHACYLYYSVDLIGFKAILLINLLYIYYITQECWYLIRCLWNGSYEVNEILVIFLIFV